MATTAKTATAATSRTAIGAHPAASRGFEWGAALLSAWVIGGLYLDGWAHSHGRVDDVFFTPWHAVLYSGVLAMALFLGLNAARYVARGHAFSQALPVGYGLALAGAMIFFVGGGLDMAWHMAFGVEVSVEALLSPSHLVLATGGVLMITGPLRSAWAGLAPRGAHGWGVLGPALISATLLLSVMSFFTDYAHPFTEAFAARQPAGRQGHQEVYVANADGTGQTRLVVAPDLDLWFAAWSPDGRQLALTGADEAGRSSLYLANADGTGLRRLTVGEAEEWSPAWSPNGADIAFTRREAGQSALYVMPASGGAARRLTTTDLHETSAAWSPDGNRLAFCGSGSGMAFDWQLYVANADGTGLSQLTTADGCAPSWSPDGSQIAFHSCVNGDCDLYRLDLAAALAGTGQPQPITSGPAYELRPSWSPDGATIVYTVDDEGASDLYAIRTDGSGHATNLTRNPGLASRFGTWSPDGQRVLYTAQPRSLFREWQRDGLGVAGILLQSALLMGVLLPLIRRWVLPFGALTFVVSLNGLLMAVFDDRYVLVPGAVVAGLLADLLLWRTGRAASAAARRSEAAEAGTTARPLPVVAALAAPASRAPFYALAFAIPALFYAMYFLTLQVTDGIGWSIHLWAGSIAMAGAVGVLAAIALRAVEQPQTTGN